MGMLMATALYTFDPRIPGIYPICPFLGLTGYHCPGCGTLRALHRLLYGDALDALGYNAFTVLALPFIAYWFAATMLKVSGLKRTLPMFFIPHQWIWAMLAGIISFWILRNIPAFPWAVLAP